MNTMSNDSFSLEEQTVITYLGLGTEEGNAQIGPTQKEVYYGCLEIFNTGKRGTLRQ